MGIRIFLILVGLGAAPYGIYCAIRPGFLEGFSGIAATTATGTIELVAMYGGLQTALGFLAFLGAFRPAFTQAALVVAAFQYGGLGLFRLCAAIAAMEISSYTAGGLVFEVAAALIAVFMRRRNPELIAH